LALTRPISLQQKRLPKDRGIKAALLEARLEQNSKGLGSREKGMHAAKALVEIVQACD
jgi:hypothetical protein